MSDIVPRARPEMDRGAVEALLRAADVALDLPALVGRRGYYRDTMGVAGVNDLGLYDDALFYVSPTAFASFNANTDPSRERPNMATLAAGVWRFAIGIHNASKDPALHPHYKALVQATEFIVRRAGTESVAPGVKDERGRCLGGGRWVGWFGINCHKGGNTTTSSEGCQTVHPSQWDEFITLVARDMARHNVASLAYLLTERV